jgi:hypothetical protein
MLSKPAALRHRALANGVLKLLGWKSPVTAASAALSECDISPYDDLCALRCLREWPDHLWDCHCAEFCGPDGTLIWEERVGADA